MLSRDIGRVDIDLDAAGHFRLTSRYFGQGC
jgi:hypothetical protein